jgi:hypothetical protein
MGPDFPLLRESANVNNQFGKMGQIRSPHRSGLVQFVNSPILRLLSSGQLPLVLLFRLSSNGRICSFRSPQYLRNIIPTNDCLYLNQSWF